jgi:hypothetical protein
MNKVEIGKAIPIFCILTAVGLVLFWIGFFTVGLAPENKFILSSDPLT